MAEAIKYSWVNALRGYAILLVILIHASQSFSVFGYIKAVGESGYLGVQLFFMLSSFTLFSSFAKRNNHSDTNVNRNYFIRRYFRIAPYYYIAIIIYLLYRGVIKGEVVNSNNLVANFTFLNGLYLPALNNPIPPGGWSVGIEVLFYLFVPILFKFIKTLGNAILFLIITLLISYILNVFYIENVIDAFRTIWPTLKPNSFYFWLPNQFPIFALGIVLYFIKKDIYFSQLIGKIVLYLSIVSFLIIPYLEYHNQLMYYILKKEYVYSVIFMCFAIGLYSGENKYLNNKYIQQLGVVSFSVYLNHFIVLTAIGYLYTGGTKFCGIYLNIPASFFRNNILFIPFYLALVYLSFIISKITYEYIEVRGIELGNKFINKIDNVSWKKLQS